MEENIKNPEFEKNAEKKPSKLSYEELAQALTNTQLQCKKLSEAYQQAMMELNARSFDATGFFLTMIFKALEHPDLYTDSFVKWATQAVEGVLISFAADVLKFGKDEPEPEKTAKTDKKVN